MQKTKQTDFWSQSFGEEYTDRNSQNAEQLNAYYMKSYGVDRDELNNEFMGSIDRDSDLLEVGANVGAQLDCLGKMGFKNLTGLELQDYAVERGQSLHPEFKFIQGTAFDMPFSDRSFDMVYTSGVLIHIHPKDLNKALDEIYRCTRRYIWGFEYYDNETTELDYRGNKNVMWKADYASLYLNRFPNLRLVKQKHVKYIDSTSVDCMYLLEKID